LTLGRYKECWNDPNSILEECATGVYLGFIPSKKGDLASSNGRKREGNSFVQTESRNYVCGQMAIGNPLTKNFLNELRRRTGRVLLVVYEGTNFDTIVHLPGEDIFISRHRTAKAYEDMTEKPWTVDFTLEHVKNYLSLGKTAMYRPITVDFWQFIIIDRETGLSFQLFDVIQDVLLMLIGDPTPKQVVKRVIREIIPSNEHGIFSKKMSMESPAELQFLPPPEVHYEGNRKRCFNPDRQILFANHHRTSSEVPSKDATRFIRRVLDDLEKCGIISITEEYEEQQTKPMIIQGTDGGLDVYFPYEFDFLGLNKFPPAHMSPPENCLLEFAKSFKENHPSAIMAKGSITTHYCAWPMPATEGIGKPRLNFGTWEGHIYQWNAMRKQCYSLVPPCLLTII
jgi:hypothetical protein